MIKNIKLISARALTIILLTIFSFLYCPLPAYPANPDINTIRIAVFPYNDIRYNALDLNISAVLRAELFKHEFIEIVPVEIIRETIYEIEPSFLWTGKEGDEKRGGILWKIEPGIIEEVDSRVSADLAVYGDITRFGGRWRIDSYVVRKGVLRPHWSMTVSGYKEEEIPEKLKGLAKEIISAIMEENILNAAEEDIRKYMGGIYTYAAVTNRIKERLDLVPGSIPLRALLLDLYLKEKDTRQDMVLNQGMKIIEHYDPSREDDTRYLLSLDLDPFDAVAEAYEKGGDWPRAIETRKKALTVFPHNAKNHKDALGRDHFYFGLLLEEKGEKKRAMDNYKESVTYLSAGSEYLVKSHEGIARLTDRN